jgi:hypothetical protein
VPYKPFRIKITVLWDIAPCGLVEVDRGFIRAYCLHGSRGSSVSIVSGYGLDDREIQVRSPAEAKNFSSSFCVQTGCGAHPVSCSVGTGGSLPAGKSRPGRDPDHSHSSSAEAVKE